MYFFMYWKWTFQFEKHAHDDGCSFIVFVSENSNHVVCIIFFLFFFGKKKWKNKKEIHFIRWWWLQWKGLVTSRVDWCATWKVMVVLVSRVNSRISRITILRIRIIRFSLHLDSLQKNFQSDSNVIFSWERLQDKVSAIWRSIVEDCGFFH